MSKQWPAHPRRTGQVSVKLSRAAHVHIETIRYYERIGLFPAPVRTVAGYRSYSLDHLKRLCFIRRARELGFSLDEVRALLRLADDPVGSCEAAHDLPAGVSPRCAPSSRI